MSRFVLTFLLSWSFMIVWADTDAYIKLYDHHGKHPRVVSVSYPGDTDPLDMYNSIYGHGAVIENPWVAFRVYIDNRQSLDLYVKQKPQIELDITGFYTTSEQLSKGYGRDVLWAGQSVAAGSFRGWRKRCPVTIDTVAERRQTVISPSCVEVFDKEWQYNGHKIDMTQKYSMKGDSRDLWVEISLSGHDDADLFCTGIQKLESDNDGFILPEGIAASWGSNIPDKAAPDLVEQVGLSIFVDPEYIVDIVEDDLNYIFVVRPDSEGKIRYRVTAAGDREIDGFKTASGWFGYVMSQKRVNP